MRYTSSNRQSNSADNIGIVADPGDRSLYLRRAETYKNKKQYQKAADDYTKVLSFDLNAKTTHT